MAADVGLPEGFQLDGPALPLGFQLDEPQAAPEPPSVTDELVRTGARTVRSLASGAAGLVDVVENPVRQTIAAGLDLAGLHQGAQTMRERPLLSEIAKSGFDSATGGIAKPRNLNDKISDLGVEMLTPGAPAIKGAQAAGKAAQTATKVLKTTEDLTQVYKDGREAMKAIDIPAEQVQTGLIQPIAEALKHENPGRHGNEVQGMLEELKDFGRKGVNANFLESFRQDLSVLPQKFAQPIRDAIDDFYDEIDLPTDFRTAYGIKRRSEQLTDALTRAGDSLTKQRNAINAFLVKQRGLTDLEKSELAAAGKSSTSEALLRRVASLTGPLAGMVAFGVSHNPMSLALGGVGQVLKAGADKSATMKIDKALNSVRTGGGKLADMVK